MKTMLFGGLAIVCLTACTVNSNRPTSWGKEGVSMLDYQTDSILCQTLAERAGADNNANTAGGINGANGQARTGGGGDSAAAGGAAGAGSNTPQTVGGGGSYRDSASPDLVSRAANQQRAREMQLKQARMDTLHSCLAGRGYTEFDLTPEQRAKLASLPQGSKERQQYLYSLGSDPANFKKSAAPAK
jgi:hypothetical protein